MAIDEAHAAGGSGDPRLTDRFVRTVERPDGGTVFVVGVVHDHPASVHRARTVVEAVDPDVLALEVSPLASELFERYATDDHEPPRFGGEYSAAIQAATDARVVGIDGPSGRFLVALARRSLDERLSLAATRRLLGGVASVSREAVTYRLLATVSAVTPFTAAVDRPVDHDCSPLDDAETQAAAERATVDRIKGVLETLDRPAAVRVRDETRESWMVRRLSDLRAEGAVVAVVGVGHLDAVAAGLEAV